jgi:hypothetical protein
LTQGGEFGGEDVLGGAPGCVVGAYLH